METVEAKPVPFLIAMRDFFGMTTAEVQEAYKKLTPYDKEELKNGLKEEGYNIQT